jgi:hypothetical protein
MNQAEHKHLAELLLAEVQDVGAKIRAYNVQRKEASALEYMQITQKMDEQGKKAMGIYAAAQVHATLATIPDKVISGSNLVGCTCSVNHAGGVHQYDPACPAHFPPRRG